MIDIDEYFNEITDEGHGSIGYHLISYKDTSLIKAIREQNKLEQKLKQQNIELKQNNIELGIKYLAEKDNNEDFQEHYNKLEQKLDKIEELMGTILLTDNGVDGNYRPIKGTTRTQCMNVLGEIQNILKTNVWSGNDNL